MSEMNSGISKAVWPFDLRSKTAEDLEKLSARAAELAGNSPYGWGHSIPIGPHRIEGILGEQYLVIARLLDNWGWWPSDMAGLEVADVGCFSGGLTAMMSSRGAQKIYAVDEIAPHLDQCRFVKQIFGLENVECIEASAYDLRRHIAPGRLDLIVLSGVLYHMSDMLVGLVAMQELLKIGGSIVIESFAVNCFEHSYANFGRFVEGAWWQPTGSCIQDMCLFSGLSRPDIRFYLPDRCLAVARKESDKKLNFRRGMNWRFDDLLDSVKRTVDHHHLSPANCSDLGQSRVFTE